MVPGLPGKALPIMNFQSFRWQAAGPYERPPF
jgi:hypothetical protein